MDTILVGIISLLAGAGIKTFFDRFQVAWLGRRQVAAEAFGAAVAVYSSVLSALKLARRVSKEIDSDRGEIQRIADSADWYLCNAIESSKTRIEKLREARLSTQAIWGPHVAALFDDFFELTSAWHNAFTTYRDDIHGAIDPNQGNWEPDATGFDWLSVIKGTAPHAELFEREIEQLMELIRQLARAAGVAIELHQLPQGVREVVMEYQQHRERRQLAVTHQAALPPAK